MMDFTAADRARSRLSWSRRELERFEQTADEADPRTSRIRRKLQENVEKAERDLRHAQGRGEGAFDVGRKSLASSPTTSGQGLS